MDSDTICRRNLIGHSSTFASILKVGHWGGKSVLVRLKGVQGNRLTVWNEALLATTRPLTVGPGNNKSFAEGETSLVSKAVNLGDLKSIPGSVTVRFGRSQRLIIFGQHFFQISCQRTHIRRYHSDHTAPPRTDASACWGWRGRLEWQAKSPEYFLTVTCIDLAPIKFFTNGSLRGLLVSYVAIVSSRKQLSFLLVKQSGTKLCLRFYSV